MNISLPKPTQILDLASKLAGPALGGPIGAALSAAFKLGQDSGDLKSALSKLSSSLQGAGPKMSSQVASQPQPFNAASISITITQNPMQAATQSPNQRFATPPMVGSESQWPAFAQAANSRITGNSQGLFDGTNPWSKNDGRMEERAAVGWVMQQNDSLRYDADNKMFYTTATDGTRTDKLSLDQVVNTIRANGGANSNAAAFPAVGKLANDAANSPGPATPQGNPLNAITGVLKQLSEMLSKTLGNAGGAIQGATKNLSGVMGSIGGAVSGGGLGSSSPIGTMGGAGSGSVSGSSNFTSTGGSGSAGGGGGAAPMSGGGIDSMMSQAEGLLRSDSMEDQLKGQKMMQQALRMFELLSKLIEKQGEMQSKAIAAIK